MCLPSDVRSGVEDFSPGGRFPPTNVVATVGVMAVEGAIEVDLPLSGGHQDSKVEEDHTEGVASEDIDGPSEDTIKLDFVIGNVMTSMILRYIDLA